MVVAAPQRVRWDRSAFYRAVEAGVFPEGGRVELLDGEVFEQMSESPVHAATVRRLRRLLESRLPGHELFVSEAHPVALEGSISDPEPDIAVVRGAPDDFGLRHPSSEDLAIICEVANSTLDFDLTTKAVLYARGEVAEYWVVDLRNRRVIVLTDPSPTGYAKRSELEESEIVTSPVIAPLAVADILG